jgi:hypothetical protein
MCERILINVTICQTKRQANFKDFKRSGGQFFTPRYLQTHTLLSEDE